MSVTHRTHLTCCSYAIHPILSTSGAPLIAVVACLGLAVDLYNATSSSELDAIVQMNGTDTQQHVPAVMAYIRGKMQYLATSHPTAVNLFIALEELQGQLQNCVKDSSSCSREQLVATVRRYAEFALQRDAKDCRQNGTFGADELLRLKDDGSKLTVLTICNTGTLA